jgi:hypothetical protein
MCDRTRLEQEGSNRRIGLGRLFFLRNMAALLDLDERRARQGGAQGIRLTSDWWRRIRGQNTVLGSPDDESLSRDAGKPRRRADNAREI